MENNENMKEMSASLHELEQQLKQFEQNLNSNNNSNISQQQSTNPTLNGMSIQQRDSIVDDLLTQYRLNNNNPNQIQSDFQSNQKLNNVENEIDNIIDNHSNYFSNLTNVSYGAYCINDQQDEHKDIDTTNQYSENQQYQLLDWIDTLEIPQQQSISNNNININSSQKQNNASTDLIYNNIQHNLRNLKRKQKNKQLTQSVDITRPSDYQRPYKTNTADYPSRRKGRKNTDKTSKNNKNNRKSNKRRNNKRSNSLPPNKKQRLSLEMAEKEEANLTFKPKINSYEFNRRIDPDVQRRLQIWNMQRKMKLTQQRKQKIEEDDYKMKESNTFQPEVKIANKRPKSAMIYGDNKYNNNKSVQNRRNSIDSTLPVQDRLYEREYQRIEKLAKTKEIIESQQMEQCSFKPNLQKTKLSDKIKSKFEDRKPIWKRCDDVRKQKQNGRIQSKKKFTKQLSKDLTFKPKINKKSKEIVENAKLYTSYYPINVSERLLLQNPKNKHIDMKNLKNDGKPFINPTSEKILKESILFREASDNFFKRQEIYELERKMKAAEQDRDTNICSNKQKEFQPNIGNAEKILAKSKRHRHRYHFEDKEQKYERLAFHDSAMIKRKTKLKAKELNKRNTFKPKINKKSSKMGRPSSIYELFQPEKSMKLKDKIQEEAEKIFKEQHPFQPKYENDLIVATKEETMMKQTASRSKIKSRCMSYEEYEDEKKRKLLEARRKLDLEKMKECTFRPQINNKHRRKTKIQEHKNRLYGDKIMVAGWDRFKELKELSLKKQQEIEQREYDVFNVSGKVLKCRKRNVNGTLQTITKPFNLATSNKIHQKCELERGLIKEGGDYDYKPETNLSKQRELVWKILKEECYQNDDEEEENMNDRLTDTLSMTSLMTYDLESDLDETISNMSMDKL